MSIDDLVRESCESQGVPERVEDKEVLRSVSALIRAERKEAGAA